MSKKIKATDIALTEDQVATLVGEITEASTRRDRVLATMNRRLDEVRAQYESELSALGSEIDAKTRQVQAWTLANRSQFEERRSRDYARGTIGLRTGNWTVTTLKGVTIKEAVKRLLSFRWGKEFVRNPDPQLNKEALLANREKIKPERLLAAGLSFEREETFFLEPKTDDAPAA